MKPEQKPSQYHDKIVALIISVVLAIAAIGLVIGVGMQAWSYWHDPEERTVM